MIKKLKKLSEEVLHTNPWYEYKHDTYELANGLHGNYYYSETNGAVLIIPQLPSGRLVLVRQFRYLAGKTSLEFPGGGIKKGLSARQAAALELKEETGYDAEDLIVVGTFQGDIGFAKDQVTIFLAKISQEDPGSATPEPHEQIEVLVRYPDEVEAMIRSNDIWDGSTLAAWALIRHHVII